MESYADVERPQPQHAPVMLAEVLAGLAPQDGGRYVDATLGLGGHSEAILAASAPGGQLLGIDADAQALALAGARLAVFGPRFVACEGWHHDIIALAHGVGWQQVDGVLFDLGVSSLQLDAAERGFSFSQDGPLDMRMSQAAALSADEIVNSWSEEELSRVIYAYGEERHARRVAAAIVRQRPLHTTGELAAVVRRAVPRGREPQRIDSATRTFQAIRIAVNGELEHLQQALEGAVSLLKPGGRLVVIAFHSLEDRIVKQYLVQEARDCICPPRLPMCVCGHRASVRIITRKPLRPTPEEEERNPRSRSARLRVAERAPLEEGA